MSLKIKKLKLVYLPFLFVAISFIILYTFFNWLLVIKLNLFNVSLKLVQLFLPIILGAIVVYFCVRPRLKLLKLPEKYLDGPFLYLLIAGAAFVVPTIIAQNYMEKATGELTVLDSITQINNTPPTKYYTVKNYYVSKTGMGIYQYTYVSGKHNNHFNIEIYFALPVFADDTENGTWRAWVGILYRKTIDTDLSDSERNRIYNDFYDDCINAVLNSDVNQFVYFERMENVDEGNGFEEAVINAAKYNGGCADVLFGINEPFEERTGSTLKWAFITLGSLSFLWFLMIIFLPLVTRNHD